MDLGAHGPSASIHQDKQPGERLALQIGQIVIIGANSLKVGMRPEPADYTESPWVADSLNHRSVLLSSS